MVKMRSNPKGTCTSYHKYFLELSFRVIISSEGNLSVLCLGHCAMMGWCPLWNSRKWTQVFCSLDRRLLPLLSPEKRNWSLLNACGKLFGENPGKSVSVSWQHKTICHEAGDGKMYLCPQLLPVTAWTLSGCCLLWKLFWDTKLALWSHWVFTANSTWRLLFQKSRHIKSGNPLLQTAELCSLSLPLHLIKSTVVEIVLPWYISM